MSCLLKPVGGLCVDPLRAVLARRAVLRRILINTGERGGGQELVAHAKALLKRTANELPAEASADAFCSFTFDDARGCGGGASRETGAGERPGTLCRPLSVRSAAATFSIACPAGSKAGAAAGGGGGAGGRRGGGPPLPAGFGADGGGGLAAPPPPGALVLAALLDLGGMLSV